MSCSICTPSAEFFLIFRTHNTYKSVRRLCCVLRCRPQFQSCGDAGIVRVILYHNIEQTICISHFERFAVRDQFVNKWVRDLCGVRGWRTRLTGWRCEEDQRTRHSGWRPSTYTRSSTGRPSTTQVRTTTSYSISADRIYLGCSINWKFQLWLSTNHSLLNIQVV